jgi:hypothetical protein
MSSQICCKCMGNVITLSECICSVQRVLQSDFQKDTILGQVNQVQGRNGQDRILENNKNIQSIISVNTNILLRGFGLEFLGIMCSTSCYEERVNFENTLCRKMSHATSIGMHFFVLKQFCQPVLLIKSEVNMFTLSLLVVRTL